MIPPDRFIVNRFNMGKRYSTINLTFLAGRKFRVIIHITVWLVLFLLPTYLLYLDSNGDQASFSRNIIQILLFTVLFYANYLVLTPYLFFRNRKILYFISALALVLLITMIHEVSFMSMKKTSMIMGNDKGYDLRIPPGPGMTLRPRQPVPGNPAPPSKGGPVFNFMLTSLFISGFGMGLCFSDKYRQQEKERKEAEKEKLNTELAFLKNQINPHFFFNTLNNIYALVQTDVKDGQKAILQLSKLMRYLLYETEKGDKPLSQEIEFMQTYIQLMKLRISEKVSISVSFPDEYPDLSIPPLLFLPFIENAFKHGISYRQPSFINVSLKVDSGKLFFECSNSITSREDTNGNDSGIGLGNVTKRLSLLFPGRHELTIHQSANVFTALLWIDLA